MIKIFYDLETSSRYSIGQILNYAFICVDEEYQIISSLYSDIKINRLELPEAGAILANRINVIDHQKNATETEWEAASIIREYIDNILYEFRQQKVALIGYNSNRFDLPYLRTVMIRNGISPYFGKNLVNLDLYQVVKFLSVTDKNFPRKSHPSKEENILSLKLETLTKEFNLLEGKQTHNSYDDVKLTIDFAKFLEENFEVNLEKFSGYGVTEKLDLGTIVYSLKPNYNLDEDSIFEKKALVLIYEDYRSTLWLDLDALKEENEKSSPIRYINKATGQLVLAKDTVDEVSRELTEKYYPKYKGLTIQEYFTKSTCDIELDIYRLDFDKIDYLHSVIWKEPSSYDMKKSVSKDAKVLLTRYKLNAYKDNALLDKSIKKQLSAYANYRYGGKLQLWKQLNEEDKENSLAYFPTLKVLEEDIREAKEKGDKDDVALLIALKEYYDSSDVKAVINQ